MSRSRSKPRSKFSRKFYDFLLREAAKMDELERIQEEAILRDLFPRSFWISTKPAHWRGNGIVQVISPYDRPPLQVSLERWPVLGLKAF